MRARRGGSVALDTTGDGRADTVQKLQFRSSSGASMASQVAQRDDSLVKSLDEQRRWVAEAMSKGDAGLDTTGDGLIDSLALDTSGDGKIDTVRRLDFAPESPRQRSFVSSVI